MAILGNRGSFVTTKETKKETYTIPVVVQKSEEGISFKKSLILSTVLHPTVICLAWLCVFVLALMGITFSMFEMPKQKMDDIEFVLVDNLPEQMPKNKNTKNRSDRNTRTGGINDPKRKVSMPSPAPTKKVAQRKATAGQKSKTPSLTEKVKSTIKPIKPNNKPAGQKSLTQPKKGPEPKPAPPTARPSVRPVNHPKATTVPRSSFTVPVPAGGTSTKKYYATGPVGGQGTATSGGSATGTGRRYAPTPSLAPTRGTGTGSGSGTGSKLSRGSSGYGSGGNPGGGGGAPGIDSLREADFGPYMRELQRRIKMNWDPPKGNESKRVVLLFRIAKDGRLLSARVFKSSGLPNADKAALHAVELTAPFRPLPAAFRGQSIDIQFTFDYNVFGASYR